jgi:hypothetical protein
MVGVRGWSFIVAVRSAETRQRREEAFPDIEQIIWEIWERVRIHIPSATIRARGTAAICYLIRTNRHGEAMRRLNALARRREEFITRCREVLEEEVPQTGVPEEGVPDERAPGEGGPEDGVPEDGAPEDGAPEEGASEEGAPEEGGPDERVALDRLFVEWLLRGSVSGGRSTRGGGIIRRGTT